MALIVGIIQACLVDPVFCLMLAFLTFKTSCKPDVHCATMYKSNTPRKVGSIYIQFKIVVQCRPDALL